MKHLRSLMKKVRRGEGGFTLIELLVVIAILGVIAAVVILNVGGFLGAGVCEAYCSEKYNMMVGYQAFVADHNGDAPTALTDLNPYLVGGVASAEYTWTVELIKAGSDASDAATKIGADDWPCECASTNST